MQKYLHNQKSTFQTKICSTAWDIDAEGISIDLLKLDWEKYILKF